MSSTAYERARLQKIARYATGNTVLDIGYAQLPNPYLQAGQRTGYDLNLPTTDAVTYEEQIQGDVRDIRQHLRGRTFDTVICAELIEHIENPYQLLRDIAALLAPQGRLILTTPNPLGVPVVVCELLRLKRFFYTTEHLYYFLPRWVERMLNFSGFELARISGIGLWLPFNVIPFCPVAFSYQVIYVATKSSGRICSKVPASATIHEHLR